MASVLVISVDFYYHDSSFLFFFLFGFSFLILLRLVFQLRIANAITRQLIVKREEVTWREKPSTGRKDKLAMAS